MLFDEPDREDPETLNLRHRLEAAKKAWDKTKKALASVACEEDAIAEADAIIERELDIAWRDR